jgi:AcrR family transcriptional regulator
MRIRTASGGEHAVNVGSHVLLDVAPKGIMTDQAGQLLGCRMARPIPEHRLRDLVQTATSVFIAQGYRRTQMADVAVALGVAKGTLYLYVESKEALFDLVVRNADGEGAIELPPELPLPSPTAGATLEYVAKALSKRAEIPALHEALARRRAGDVRLEFEGILRALYGTLARNRNGLKLIDRCAADYPELAALWFGRGRELVLGLLGEYLRHRRSHIRPFPDATIAARIVLETLVFWAVHRHWDPAPQQVDERVAEDTVVEFLLHAVVKERSP